MSAVYRADWSWRQKNQYFQERLAAKLIYDLKDCANVIFEMFNEGEWYDQEQRRQHEEHFLRFFRQRTSAPLMTNTDHIRTKNYEPRKNPAVDILSFHKKPWTGHFKTFESEFQAEPARAIFESEPVPSFGFNQAEFGGKTSLDTLRAAVWERTLGGAGWVAQNDTSFGWDARCAMAQKSKLRDEAYDQIGHAARFFNQSGITFWQMAPHSEQAGTGICLARPGIEYVVYAPTSGAFTVNLSAAKGRTLIVRWYDPRKGVFQAGGNAMGGEEARKFTAPFAGDAALHLKVVAGK